MVINDYLFQPPKTFGGLSPFRGSLLETSLGRNAHKNHGRADEVVVSVEAVASHATLSRAVVNVEVTDHAVRSGRVGHDLLAVAAVHLALSETNLLRVES